MTEELPTIRQRAEERLQSLTSTGGIGVYDADDLLRDIAALLSTLAVERAARERAEEDNAVLLGALRDIDNSCSRPAHIQRLLNRIQEAEHPGRALMAELTRRMSGLERERDEAQAKIDAASAFLTKLEFELATIRQEVTQLTQERDNAIANQQRWLEAAETEHAARLEAEDEAAALRQALFSIRKDVHFAHTTVNSPGKWDVLCEEIKRQVDAVTPNGAAGARVLSELARLRAALEQEQAKNKAWEVVASGMADVIRERGEALEPFARFCAVYDKGYALQAQRDEDAVYQFSDAVITLGDLRRAAETHKQSEEPQ
jgi:DNA repair exonuclease SbcCD ATPase subunit